MKIEKISFKSAFLFNVLKRGINYVNIFLKDYSALIKKIQVVEDGGFRGYILGFGVWAFRVY